MCRINDRKTTDVLSQTRVARLFEHGLHVFQRHGAIGFQTQLGLRFVGVAIDDLEGQRELSIGLLVRVMRSMSITGSAKPECTSMSPQSCISVNV